MKSLLKAFLYSVLRGLGFLILAICGILLGVLILNI